MRRERCSRGRGAKEEGEEGLGREAAIWMMIVGMGGVEGI
jgi:hypothetical protein